MINNIFIKNIARFVLLVFLQVLIFNKITPGGLVSPHIYLIFLLLLPAKINKSFLLILAFVTGLTIDYFANTLGLNAAACVAMAFIRPGLITLLFRSHEFSSDEEPLPSVIGLNGFIKYTFIMVFVQQLIVVYFELLSIRYFFSNMLNVLSGTILTTLLIIITIIFTTRRK